MLRRRGGVLERLLHHGERAGARAGRADRARRGAVRRACAPSREAAAHGIARMRFALGVDDDLRPFLRAFAARPADRAARCAAGRGCGSRAARAVRGARWAICEQLIEYERAAAIERRLLARSGAAGRARTAARSTLRDLPAARGARRHRAGAAAVLRPRRLAARWRWCAPPARSRAGASTCTPRPRARLAAPARDPGIGRGRSRCSRCTARAATTSSRPATSAAASSSGGCSAAATPAPSPRKAQVREFFAPYGEWAGLAAAHML